MALKDNFITYQRDINTSMTDTNSLYKSQIDGVGTLFDEFGLDAEQKSKVLSTIYSSSIQYINQYSTQSSLQLLSEEKSQEKTDKEILLLDAQIRLIEQQILSEVENTTLISNKALDVLQDTQLKVKQEALIDQQILESVAKVNLLNQQKLTEIEQTILVTNNANKVLKDILLVEEQVLTQAQQTILITNQALTEVQNALKVIEETKLSTRRTQALDDNLKIKNIENQGGLASFAVNSGSDSAQGAINDLKGLMYNLNSRTAPVTGEVEYELQTAPPIPPVTKQLFSIPNQNDIGCDPVPTADAFKLYKNGVYLQQVTALELGGLGVPPSFVDSTAVTGETHTYEITALRNGYESNKNSPLELVTP